MPSSYNKNFFSCKIIKGYKHSEAEAVVVDDRAEGKTA
jgi:hypothetical protein